MRCGKAGHKQPRTPRRAAQFWAPLNNWWRSWLAENDRRPVTSELQEWYNVHADTAWPTSKPSWKEARIHAKCLRSTEQVKQYFRQYRARSKAGDSKQEPGEDGSGSFECSGGGGGAPQSHEHGLMLAGPSQGAPDTLDLLVSSHNARIAQMNLGVSFGSPFAAQTQSAGAQTSAPPPMWQQFGKAASERLNGRRSMPDMLAAGLGGDRSLSFGAGSYGLGPSISFLDNRSEKSMSPFSLVTSGPAPNVAEVLAAAAGHGHAWSDVPPRSSSPQDSTGYPPVSMQQRRVTAEHPHPRANAAPPSPAAIRFTRSFNQASGSSLSHDALLEASLTDPSAPVELPWSRPRSQYHARIDELGACGVKEELARRELLRMAVQDALGSDLRGSQHGGLASAAAMMPLSAPHLLRRQEAAAADPPNQESELSELWALTEDEPVTQPPMSSSSLQPLSQAGFIQDAASQMLHMQAVDRASASSDPGPLLPQYPRSVSFPMSSHTRAVCLSADGMAPHARPPQDPSLSLLAARHSGMHGPSAAGFQLSVNRRSSDSCAVEPSTDGGHMTMLASAPSSLGMDIHAESRSTWPNQQQQQQWAHVQQQQQQLQLQQLQLPPMHGLRVNSSRVPMTRREKEELEQQMLVEAHNQLLWPHQERAHGTHAESSELLGDQAPRCNPWGEMEWK